MNYDNIHLEDIYYLHKSMLWYDKVKTRKTLIERIQTNPDDKSWEEFEYFYREFIYNIIRSMGLSHHDAEDLRQQVMLKCWKGLGKMTYDPAKKPFRSWMSTVVKNTVRSFYTKKTTKKEQQEDNLDDSYDDCLSTGAEIDEIAEQEWKLHISRLALQEMRNRFSPKMMSVFEAFLEGKSGEQVAADCEMNVNSVFVYKSRVQNAMYKEIIRLNQDLN